jgi:hypothetical protein
MNDLLVVLVMTVCIGGGDGSLDSLGSLDSCEEFEVSMWRGPDALALCRKEMEEGVEVWEGEGVVQTWKCEEI